MALCESRPKDFQGATGAVAITVKELVRIGTPILAHRKRLSAPDQLGAADPEAPPAPQGELPRIAVLGSIPALHGLYHPAVRGGFPADFQVFRQGRFARAEDFVVDWNIRAESVKMPTKAVDTAMGAHAGIARIA